VAIAALLFDVGGVLLERPHRRARAAWEAANGRPEGFLDTAITEAIGAGWEGGLSEDAVHARLLALCGLEPPDLGVILAVLEADERVCPRMVAFLDEMRGRHRLAVVSNAGPDARAYFVERRGFDRWFELIVISAEERIAKPDPEIYRRAAERLGLSPTECLFVDDKPRNVEAAAALGMSAVHFTTPEATLPLIRERIALRS
jgi:epoxide hydrolase-like predicted phosphatase